HTLVSSRTPWGAAHANKLDGGSQVGNYVFKILARPPRGGNAFNWRERDAARIGTGRLCSVDGDAGRRTAISVAADHGHLRLSGRDRCRRADALFRREAAPLVRPTGGG